MIRLAFPFHTSFAFVELAQQSPHSRRKDIPLSRVSASTNADPNPGNPTVETAELLPLPPEPPPEPPLPVVEAEAEPVTTVEAEMGGGFVLLSLSSMYALFIGWLRHEMTGSILNGG